MVGGVLLGILVGVLPGLGAPNGVTLLMPLTFSMEPISGIIVFSSMYWGALFGGSTTSILFNIPGEPSSVATTFDGYPLASDGRPRRWPRRSSAGFGALAGVIVVTLVADSIAIPHSFRPAGIFRRLPAGLLQLHRHGRAASRRWCRLLVGLAVATIGMDTISGESPPHLRLDQLVGGIRFWSR